MKQLFKISAILVLITIVFSCKSTKVVEQIIVNIPKEIEEPKAEPSNETIANFLSEYLKLKYKDRSFEKYMYVSVKHQRLYLIKNDSTIKKYSISSPLSLSLNKKVLRLNKLYFQAFIVCICIYIFCYYSLSDALLILQED